MQPKLQIGDEKKIALPDLGVNPAPHRRDAGTARLYNEPRINENTQLNKSDLRHTTSVLPSPSQVADDRFTTLPYLPGDKDPNAGMMRPTVIDENTQLNKRDLIHTTGREDFERIVDGENPTFLPPSTFPPTTGPVTGPSDPRADPNPSLGPVDGVGPIPGTDTGGVEQPGDTVGGGDSLTDQPVAENPQSADLESQKLTQESIAADPMGYLTERNLLNEAVMHDIYQKNPDGSIKKDLEGNPLVRPEFTQEAELAARTQVQNTADVTASQAAAPTAIDSAQAAAPTSIDSAQAAAPTAISSAVSQAASSTAAMTQSYLSNPVETEAAVMAQAAQASPATARAILAEYETAQAAADVVVQEYETSLVPIDEINNTLAKVKEEKPMEAASVAEKLNGLIGDMENGNVPLWARPAVTAVEQQLEARGISASSVGRDSLFNAIINAAMPIASADAQFEQQASASNYDSRVKAIFQDSSQEFAARQFNANSINQRNQFISGLKAQVDMSNASRKDAMAQFNANAANQASIVNAQLGTQVSVANAQNATQASIANAQMNTQVNLANANAENQVNLANAQFAQQSNLANVDAMNKAAMANAQMQQQTNLSNAQFAQQTNLSNAQLAQQALLQEQQLGTNVAMANAQLAQQALLQEQQLGTNVAMSNAQLAQQALLQQQQLGTNVAMSNAQLEQQAAMQNQNIAAAAAQHQSSLDAQREQFNAQQANVINQATVQWRRQINSADTATQNQINAANVANAFNLSSQAQNNLWQQVRDEAHWAHQASENELQRRHETAIRIMQWEHDAAMQEGAAEAGKTSAWDSTRDKLIDRGSDALIDWLFN